MITNEQLTSAVKAGILDEATAEALKAHQPNQTKPNNAPLDNIVDEEYFRLVSSFNDIFVVIASVLLFISLSWIGGNMIGPALTAIAAWGLAEFFVRKRRMALPAIVLLLYFVTSIFSLNIHLFGGATKLITGIMAGENTLPVIGSSIISILAAWTHWKRFKVPITVAAGAAFVVAAIAATAMSIVPNKVALMPIISLVGLGVFALAMYWDAADIKRETRKSDVGFWLHLLAAPLIIHPIFEMLGVLNGKISLIEASFVLSLYALIAVISLIIDRRALMVSALGYVIYVLSTLFSLQEGASGAGFAMTAFVIGSALLMLSAFWHSCRVSLLRFTPENFKRYLPN